MKLLLITLFLNLFLFQFGISQVGRVGINTISPAAMLHVKDGSVLFASGAIAPFVNPPASGPGIRMMWYINKISFRAGYVDGNQWNYDSIGFYSVGLGINVIAVGYNSTAFGSGTFASGVSSTAFGLDTKATGYASMAISADTKAQGNQSFAAGSLTIANGFASTVIGILNDPIVEPQTNESTPTTPLFIIGNGSSTNARSNALTVLKNGNIGIGTSSPGFLLNFPNALGDKIALWGNSGAHYGFGVVSGYLQIHSDVVSSDIAFGYGSSSSFTETMRIRGNGNVGIGTTTPEFKLDVSARMRLRSGGAADTSPGIWFNEIDNSGVASFFGMFNDDHIGIYSGLVGVWFYRMNMLNGNLGLGVTPTEKLHVLGNGLFTGTVTASCGVLVCSDVRYKRNILPLTNVLSGIQSLNGVYYHWDKETFPEIPFNDERQIGIIAQELEKVFPEVVHTDASGYKTVDYSRLSPILLEAIKEQQQIIDHQQKQIDMLISELTKLKEIFTEIGSRREQ